MKVSASYDLENPDIEKEMKSEKPVKKSKRKHKLDTESGTDSEASVFESGSEALSVIGSDYSSGGSNSSDSSSTDSEEERRRRRIKKKQQQKKRRHQKYSSTSESADSYSDFESDSEGRTSRKKSIKRHNKKR